MFLEYRIDFCCGGNRPLAEAIEEKNLDANEILDLLNKRYEEFQNKNEEFTDWVKEKPSRLIDYIVDKHHAYLNEELPNISELVKTILRVHGKTHNELFEVHKLFSILKSELEEHLIKEEELLFPLIKEYELNNNNVNKQQVLDALNELEEEHDRAGDVIKKLMEITNHYTAPSDGCTTFNLTYKKLMELEKDLFQHIHLENNILFKNI